MAKYKVLATILHRIDHEAGFKDDGTPKKVVEHTQGEEIDFPGYDEDRLQQLVDLHAIIPVEDAKKQEEEQAKYQDEGAAAVQEFLKPPEEREQSKEATPSKQDATDSALAEERAETKEKGGDKPPPAKQG